MRKSVILAVTAILVMATFPPPTNACNPGCVPPPSPFSNPVYMRFYQALAVNNINNATNFLNEANSLLDKAKSAGKDTGSCEKLIGEAKGLIEQAKLLLGNPYNANRLALKAIKLLKDALACLG